MLLSGKDPTRPQKKMKMVLRGRDKRGENAVFEGCIEGSIRDLCAGRSVDEVLLYRQPGLGSSLILDQSTSQRITRR